MQNDTPTPPFPNEWPRWIWLNGRSTQEVGFVNLRQVAAGPDIYIGAAAALAVSMIGWGTIFDMAGISREPDMRIEYEEIRAKGTRVISLPFSDGVEVPKAYVEQVLGVLATTLPPARHPVLFQCAMGLSRSASMAYIVLRVVHKLDHAEALRRVEAIPGWPHKVTLASAVAHAERLVGRAALAPFGEVSRG